MGATSQVSALTFSAFLRYPTKAHLLAIGEPAPDGFFVDIEAHIVFVQGDGLVTTISTSFQLQRCTMHWKADFRRKSYLPEYALLLLTEPAQQDFSGKCPNTQGQDVRARA